MSRVALTLEYDGTGLCGWQRQANGPTVQEHLETALAALMGRPTPVVGASRTDAGVHALGQVAHFDMTREIPMRGVLRGLNSHLPETIAVTEARPVEPEFHARFSSRGKDYRYLVWNRPTRAPLLLRRAWFVPRPLDREAMDRAAQVLVGENDFAAFRASGCSARTTTRRILGIAVRRAGDHGVAIWVRGDAFLRNMVRIVAGTLVDVGLGRLTSRELVDILESRDRTRAGQTAPAHGLTLVRVFFRAPPATAPSESLSIM